MSRGLMLECRGVAVFLLIAMTMVSVGQKHSCVPESDPMSPRKSALKSVSPGVELLRLDLDKDGDPDILECWMNGKRLRWFDENDDLTGTDLQGDLSDDSVQIDRDGDGFYDGPGDMNVDYIDDDGDGQAELEAVAMNPNRKQKGLLSGDSHWMIFEDVDKDGVFGCINWETFKFECWGIDPKDPNFKPDYNGDSIFLKEHLPAWAIEDPSLNWENPFAFFDRDNDGVTEMAVRYCDNRVQDETTSETWKYDGVVDEVYTSWDLDNDTGRNNEMDFDMTLRMTGGAGLDYRQYVNEHPKLKAPDWVLPYFRFTNWRTIDKLVYVPHDKCYDEMFKPEWGDAIFTFDEDDDDHRWERVELYFPSRDGLKADPYKLGKWDKDANTTEGIAGHPQSDTLGDRGEFDEDYSGKAQLYIGRFDGRYHLHGAEWGAWLVDMGGKYWGGAGPARGTASPDKATTIGEVVQYKDTDGNGFVDDLVFDYDGDRIIDLHVNLLELGDGLTTSPVDEAALIDPAGENWEGLSKRFKDLACRNWEGAMTVYSSAWKRGLTTPEIRELAIASSVGEKYIKAYQLRELVFRSLHERVKHSEPLTRELLQAHFIKGPPAVAAFIDKLEL